MDERPQPIDDLRGVPRRLTVAVPRRRAPPPAVWLDAGLRRGRARRRLVRPAGRRVRGRRRQRRRLADTAAGIGRSPRSGSPALTPTRRACASSPTPTTRYVGWKQLNVEVYGGILNNSWLDRDLGIAGRLTMADGSYPAGRRPIAASPACRSSPCTSTAASTTGSSSTRSSTCDRCGASVSAVDGDFADWIAERGRVRAAGVLGAVPVRRATGGGARRRRVAARQRPARQPGLVLGGGVGADRSPSRTTRSPMIVLNDHEEVGSSSTTGAGGPLLERVHGTPRDCSRRRRATTSCGRSPARCCVSADNAHAVHPNYAERHDPDHRPMVNAGPAIKINSNQRYATSPATAAAFRRACERPGCRGRCSSRATTCRAVRRSDRSRRRGSGSPPSTSASRSCRCTRRASCAASTTRRRWLRR